MKIVQEARVALAVRHTGEHTGAKKIINEVINKAQVNWIN